MRTWQQNQCMDRSGMGPIFPLVIGFATFALAACNTPIGTEVARASARTVVTDIVETRFPGLPISPITDCIINNASGNEIVSIAGDALAGQPSPETVRLVIEIAARPDTVTCFVEEAGPTVLPAILAASV